MIVVAPSPKKPFYLRTLQEDDACQELRQILTTTAAAAANNNTEHPTIVRTGNPLPQDSSFILPIHHLQVGGGGPRPRSFSVGSRF